VFFAQTLDDRDAALVERVRGFLPRRIFDLHAHLHNARYYPPTAWPMLASLSPLGCEQHRSSLLRLLQPLEISGLHFPLPHVGADRLGVNSWLAAEVSAHGTPASRSLILAAPEDGPESLARQLTLPGVCGFKVYHCYAARRPTTDSEIEEYAPDWMWELLDGVAGILMLHVVRDAAMADEANQRSLRRLCRRYPRVQVVLAHVARSFCHHHARAGLRAVASLDNVVVDTSVICDESAFAEAIETLGIHRVLWGSDFPVSEFRGRCVTVGDGFHWLYAREGQGAPLEGFDARASLIGLESLVALKVACERAALTATDLSLLFDENARRLLRPFLPAAESPERVDIPARWHRTKELISGGTGLMSKRAEQFDPEHWPTFFSRCEGCEVWDLEHRRFLDFAGGVGAVLLGYADPYVNAAVQRRVSQGNYCTLVSPDEHELAELLLALHPWAGKVRYARGGGDAMGVAVRIARAETGRSGIAFCGYHGWQDWYLAANLGRTHALDGHLLPGLEPRGVPRELAGTAAPFRYNDLASFDEAIGQLEGNLAAVVMEPMRSQWPKEGFLETIAQRCRAAGAVLVIDEVTSGLRYGFPGASARLGLQPDLVVYAKAMSNGFPFGAVVGRKSLMEAGEASFISSSYWTDGIGTAAALAVLRRMQTENLFEEMWSRGLTFRSALEGVVARHPLCRVSVTSMPTTPTLAFDLGPATSGAQKQYVREMLQRGILAASFTYLMVAHSDDARARFLAAVDESLAALSLTISRDGLTSLTNPNAPRRGFARLA
jgi:glutamate-1-semialdehyde 2,1-aminomutase